MIYLGKDEIESLAYILKRADEQLQSKDREIAELKAEIERLKKVILENSGQFSQEEINKILTK